VREGNALAPHKTLKNLARFRVGRVWPMGNPNEKLPFGKLGFVPLRRHLCSRGGQLTWDALERSGRLSAELGWLQLAASASLTLMGLTVSIVAAVFTYRNNFGWPPLVLITSIGLSSGGGENRKYNALVGVEIWNRRKYPLIVRGVSASIEGLELIDDHTREDRIEWYIYRNSINLDSDHAMDPQSHKRHKISAPFETVPLDAINAPINVEVMFFDPRLNRTTTLKARGLYTFNSRPKAKAGWRQRLLQASA